MPIKRAIMIGVGKDQVLRYALRVDVPKGAEVRLPTYHSSYGDPADPDLKAIQQGRVLEKIRSASTRPEVNENKNAVLARLQNQIRAEWKSFDRQINESLLTFELQGRYWDGSAWRDPGR